MNAWVFPPKLNQHERAIFFERIQQFGSPIEGLYHGQQAEQQ